MQGGLQPALHFPKFRSMGGLPMTWSSCQKQDMGGPPMLRNFGLNIGIRRRTQNDRWVYEPNETTTERGTFICISPAYGCFTLANPTSMNCPP
jgi:hypothetical protein